jgi:hypothetical protein
VGWSFTSSGLHHAFIWKNEELYDLNNMVFDIVEFDYLEHAYDINDRGQIVVSARVNGEFPHAFLLTPISETSIDAILEYFYEGVADETIEGLGRPWIANHRLRKFEHMLEAAQWHFENDRISQTDTPKTVDNLTSLLKSCIKDITVLNYT